MAKSDIAKSYEHKVEKLDDSKIKISVEVSPKKFKEEKDEVYNKLKDGVEVKGFRPGQAPRNLIKAKLGGKLFEETINHILPNLALEIVKAEKLNPVSQLQYNLEKVSDIEGLIFNIEFEALEEIELPNLKKIKVKKDEIKIETKEVNLVINDMYDRAQAAKNKATKTKSAKSKPDDKWAEKLGIPNVKTIANLKKEVEKQLKVQKEHNVEEKYRADILDEISKLAKIKVPKGLIERELINREDSYRKRIEDIGLEFDEFLKSKNTTLNTLKKDWEEDAKKRIAREILLVEVAKKNDLKVDKKDIEKELEVITDPQAKSQYDNERGRNYIATVLIQQKAITWIIDQIKG